MPERFDGIRYDGGEDLPVPDDRQRSARGAIGWRRTDARPVGTRSGKWAR
ncbi:hypothetical protein GCM10010430_64130 [Kitasatospora cystarginea]|uniref:Uncharacterized protein n=1 Tax=Kitasatospora cystarginea TaxID=58350 RepID=A0ABN3ETN4_9ACTN